MTMIAVVVRRMIVMARVAAVILEKLVVKVMVNLMLMLTMMILSNEGCDNLILFTNTARQPWSS